MEKHVVVGNKSKTQPAIPPSFHVYNKRRIYACKVTGLEVNLKFARHTETAYSKDEIYYATCSPYGKVDWQTTTIYTPHNLVPMDNIHVVAYLD